MKTRSIFYGNYCLTLILKKMSWFRLLDIYIYLWYEIICKNDVWTTSHLSLSHKSLLASLFLLSTSDIYIYILNFLSLVLLFFFLVLLSCSLVNSSSKCRGNCVSNSSLAASSLSGIRRSSTTKKEENRLSNKRKDDWAWRVVECRIERKR